MANVITTPNMSLPNPVPGVDSGPDYANNNQACFNILDQHNHSSGSGVQITPAGLNINTDLPFSGNNAIALRSIRLLSQASPLALSTDLGCLYESGVDLYYNDGNGNQIRITQSGSVSGASGTITGLPSGTASASYSSISETFTFQQATNTAANMDAGTLIIRYPGSYPTPSGNYIALQAPTSLSSGYALTLPATVPGANSAFVVSNTGGSLSYLNVDNATLDIASGLVEVKPGGITSTQIASQTVEQGNLAVRTVATTVPAGGVAMSASCGNFFTTVSTPVNVSNLSVTITTTGRPVMLMIQAAPLVAGPPTVSVIENVSSGQFSTINFLRAGTAFSSVVIGANGALNPSIYIVDPISAGTYTYSVQAFVSASGATFQLLNSLLVAYEL